jgi:hypothetical protein
MLNTLKKKYIYINLNIIFIYFKLWEEKGYLKMVKLEKEFDIEEKNIKNLNNILFYN